MIYLSIIDPFIKSIDEPSLDAAAQAVLEHQKVNLDEVDLSIVVTDNASIQDLNREYRGIGAPTDVLSFSLNEKDPETGRLYLGDVIISFPFAQEQAVKAGHPVMSEVALLAVHGVLHLLGYDHAEPEEKEKMWQVQQEILTILKVMINKWPED
jgi:probable rRNA maturation factor